MKRRRFQNRWIMALAAVGMHLSIGSIYAYSAWSMPLENSFGWSATQTSFAFSIAIFTLGLSAAFLGKTVARRGVRFGCIASTICFCTGLAGSALACQLESLPLFYLCFGGISGVGLGLGYVSPVSTLVKWFPERRGFATGLAIMGFGFGGMVCTQLIDVLVPVVEEVQVSAVTEVIDANVRVVGVQPHPHEGEHSVLVYEKQSIVGAFWILSCIYGCIMLPSALVLAAPGGAGKTEQASALREATAGKEQQEYSLAALVRSPAFAGLWFLLFLNATCGIALIATAKKMGYEMVHLSAGAASILVMGISVCNGLGRIFWSSLSDRLGRANVFVVFFVLQLVAFPLLAHSASVPALFMLLTFVILTCYGGGFSTMPAYISDLFGVHAMAAVFGWILTAWSCAGIVGPMLNTAVVQATGSYQLSLYLLTILLVIGLMLALWMKRRFALQS